MIIINGKPISGKNISVSGNKVIVDGKEVSGLEEQKVINIEVTGDIQTLQSGNGSVSVKGDVGSIETVNGDIEIEGDVKLNIKTVNGDVSCGAVGGSVSSVNGSIKTRKENEKKIVGP